MMHRQNYKDPPVEHRTDRDPRALALRGDAGAEARAAKLARLDTINKRIQAQRRAGASRHGFVALERLSEAVAAARETIEAHAQASG